MNSVFSTSLRADSSAVRRFQSKIFMEREEVEATPKEARGVKEEKAAVFNDMGLGRGRM